MKPGYRHKTILALLIICGWLAGIRAQSRYDSSYAELASMFPENVVMFTDRTLYSVNEVIRYSAVLQSGGNPYRGIGSTVLYVELVDRSGLAVAKTKRPIATDGASGQLTVPSNLTPGIYCLRSYTQWMRNFGSLSFTYLPVRIVNPYSKKASANGPVQQEHGMQAEPPGVRTIEITIPGQTYGRGETMDVEFSITGSASDHAGHVCVTVVPEGTIDTTLFRYKARTDTVHTPYFQFNHLPEVNGTTISGIAVERVHDRPAADIGIHFSVFGQDPDYFVARTDQEGRFQVITPKRFGVQEMLVVPESRPGILVEVQIDNDFTSDPLPFDPGSMNLNREELILASRLSLNMQLERAYLKEADTGTSAFPQQAGLPPFYGIPGFSVKIDEFVNLPNLEEIIENLIPKTYLVRREGGKSFWIKGENPMLSLFPPLVLVDHVPVFDMDVILAISPARIDHIDVIRDVYVLGDLKFGGIISIASKSGDLAGIQLPEDSYFFDYPGYQPSLPPRIEGNGSPGKIPDTRNTLYWKEGFELKKEKSFTANFRASSTPGKYLILVRGILSDGTLAYGTARFEVK